LNYLLPGVWLQGRIHPAAPTVLTDSSDVGPGSEGQQRIGIRGHLQAIEDPEGLVVHYLAPETTFFQLGTNAHLASLGSCLQSIYEQSAACDPVGFGGQVVEVGLHSHFDDEPQVRFISLECVFEQGGRHLGM
jgi:hypothetical protein